MFYDTSLNMFNHFNIDYAFSGNTAPIFTGNYAFWYDTANNVIKRTADGGVTWVSGMSFPTCIVSGIDESSPSSAICSIDQVFNGFGYIGSTLWVDKGVKGLIPNGRNEDGTLNNREFTTSKVLTRTFPNADILSNASLFVSGTAIGRLNIWHYNEEQNLNIQSDGNEYLNVYYGNCDLTNGVISNFQPKLPFRAVDYNDALVKADKEEIMSWLMPDYTTAVAVTGGFTAQYKGWLMGQMNGYSAAYGTGRINGYSIGTEYSDYVDIQVMMDVGDVFTTDATNFDMNFFALKGNNK